MTTQQDISVRWFVSREQQSGAAVTLQRLSPNLSQQWIQDFRPSCIVSQTPGKWTQTGDRLLTSSLSTLHRNNPNKLAEWHVNSKRPLLLYISVSTTVGSSCYTPSLYLLLWERLLSGGCTVAAALDTTNHTLATRKFLLYVTITCLCPCVFTQPLQLSGTR